MDFLLSFRLFESYNKLQTSKPIRSDNTYWEQTTPIKFLLLSVDNRIWKFLQIQGIFFRYIITTYTIAFLENENGINTHDFVNTIIDVFYFMDLVSAITYRAKWPKDNRKLDDSSSHLSKLVWRNCLFKPRDIWMIIIDVISLIPFEVIRIWVPYDSIIHTIAHCSPALRIYRLPIYYADAFKRISLRVHVLLELFIKVAVFWILITHTMTCMWYWLAQRTPYFIVDDLPQKVVFDTSKPFNWYLITFYYVQVGFANIGFGDLFPTSDVERAATIIIASVGFIMLCGYLIAALSSVLAQESRRLTHLRLRLSLMTFELSQKKVPEHISKKILKFYYSLWATRRGVGPFNELLMSLPKSISSSVFYDIFTPALNASLMFRSCDEFSKRAIAEVMTINLYMAGDVILKRNEINTKMFYIRKGTIQIMSYQDDETQIMTFGAGTVFGQFSLILSLPAKSEIHAATFCEIHSIARRNLFVVLSDYPKAKSIVLNVHKNLLLNVLADKYDIGSKEGIQPENALRSSSFYKVPLEASKLARDDICVVTSCPYVFEPGTIFLKVWNTLVALIIVVICFYYPYCAAFDRKYPFKVESIIIVIDLILCCNIYLSFSTAFVRENILFSSLRDIAAVKLITVSTYIDVVSILPVHYFLNDSNRIKPVLLCLRCLEFYKIPVLFSAAEYTVDMTMISLLRMFKYVLYFLFGGYAIGMVYYMQACYTDPCLSYSWYPNSNVTKEADSPIWVSLYFAILVMSGTGYGDVTVNDVTDIAYVTVFCIIGVLLYIYLISEYSANLSLSREPRQNFTELADRVNTFLMSHKMLSSERIRVRQFLNLQWERNMGYEFTFNHDLFYDTPYHLLFEASQHTRSRGLHSMELFKGMGEGILSCILNSSYRRVFSPHEVVIYAGEVCATLLVIEEGCCEATYGKDISVKKILTAGMDVCTVELMLGLTSMCHVRTLTHCTIMKVPKTNLQRAFALNPMAAKELQNSILELKNSPFVHEIQKTRPVRLHLTVRSSVQKSLYHFRYYRKQGGNKELSDPYLKLGLCQWIRFFLRSVTVLPYGKLLKRWEMSRSVFAFCSAVLFPCLPYFELECPELYYIGFFLDITAWIDLLHVCYYNSKNLLVSHPLWTCGHYIKGSFVLDFIFCFPFDRIMFRPLYDSEGKAFVSDNSIDVLRLLRVGQIYRIPPAVNNLGIDFLSTPNLFWILMMITALTIVFLNFLTSVLVLLCVNYKASKDGSYYIVIQPKVKDHFLNVLNRFKFSTKPSLVFLINFYWISVTAFGLGFGDITAVTKELMIYVVIVIVFSYLYFNYVTILIASYLSSININLTIFQKRMNHLIKYLKAENVEPILRQHIINHFEYVWKKSKGIKPQSVFINFTLALKDDVMAHLYEETLKGVLAFSHLDPAFFRTLSSRLSEVNFQAGAAIYKQGDIISEIFIIHQGEVTIVGENEDETEILGRSKVFGQLENIPKGIIWFSAVATKNVTVLKIKTQALYQLLTDMHGVIEERGQEEKLRLREALVKSNEVNSDESEESSKLIPNKTKTWFVHVTYKFSKHILITYVILSLFSANKISYDLAFQTYDIILLFTIVPIELIFIFKIFLGFNTGYVDEAGEFVSDARLIKARYMRITGFYLDFFTVIPFELFALAASPDDQIYVASWLRITRILRLYNVWYFFNLKFDTLSVNMLVLKILAVAVWTGTLLHQCSCIWYLISCPRANCPESLTWNLIIGGSHNFNRYLNCLYFVVVVLTTTGFGDITPHTLIEIIYVIVLVFVAFFYTAIFIGQMVSTAQKSLYAKTNYEFQVEGLKTYLHVNDVPYETQKMVLRYVDNIWRNEKGQQIPELLMSAPAYLLNEIKLSTYGHHIHNNPVFRDCNPQFKRHLIIELSRIVFFPGDIVVHEGEVNRTAYFVHVGLVESKDRSKKQPNKIYGENSYFGMKQGVKKSFPHSKTYYAKTLCVILSLKLQDWSFLTKFFPEDFQFIKNKINNEDIE